MPAAVDSVFARTVQDSIDRARAAAAGLAGAGRAPFASPHDWRDRWVYFLMLDRFANPVAPPAHPWNRPCGERQGGTFTGVQSQLAYLADLGVGAIWITPVVKNPMPATWSYNYHGYAAQDLLAIDPRFASDGRAATAARELRSLVDAAHDHGMHVILDVVLNHTARVFDYWSDGSLRDAFSDPALLRSPPLAGGEAAVAWLDGLGLPHAEWTGDPPDPLLLHADDAIHPAADFRTDYFRRRGSKTDDEPDWPQTEGGFVPGDFGTMRQLVVEYRIAPGDPRYDRWGPHPVLTLLTRACSYLVAEYDVDGFRIDTVKYVDPRMVQYFGNAMREFALSIGKRNFFTFGEIWDDEETVARFVGRNGGASEGFGIDAAVDFPLHEVLKTVPKALGGRGVEDLRELFEHRRAVERSLELLSSHGEASRYFVTFLDNHDKNERIRHPETTDTQVHLALGLLFTLQGIPCLYYGTEQGLSGTVDEDGRPSLPQFEGVREALWGKPGAFDRQHADYLVVQRLARLRRDHAALRYGRQYFRPVSGNGSDFGRSRGVGGIVAFSRVLGDREVLVVGNTHPTAGWSGRVLCDRLLNADGAELRTAFRSLGDPGAPTTITFHVATFWEEDGSSASGPCASVAVELAPGELQVLVQE